MSFAEQIEKTAEWVGAKTEVDAKRIQQMMQDICFEMVRLELLMKEDSGLGPPAFFAMDEIKSKIVALCDKVRRFSDENSEDWGRKFKVLMDSAELLQSNANRGCDVHSISNKEVREAVWNMTGGKCSYCDCDLEPNGAGGVSFAVDHVVPKSAGGPDNLANYVPACSSCNSAKNGGHVLEFIRKKFPNRAAVRPNLAIVDTKASA